MPAFYGAIDLQKNELRNAVVQNLGSAPGTPSQGQMYYDSTGKILYWWDGTTWQSAKGGTVAMTNNAPTTIAIADVAAVGVGTAPARDDHKHGMAAFAAVTAATTYGIAAANGSAATLARSDHTHGSVSLTANTPSTQAIGDAAALGAGTAPAKDDHKHGMPGFGTVAVEQTFASASTSGAAATVSRSDHAHGNPTHDATAHSALLGNVTAETAAFGSASANGSATTISRSDHAHGNPAHDVTAHSGIPLNQYAQPTNPMNFGGQQLTNVGNPAAATDGANKQYVDNAINGLGWKAPVRVASTANLALSGLVAVDGVTVTTNDRVLAKNQTTASANGIYVASAAAWTRATDNDTAAEMLQAATYVEEGTTLSDTAWVCTTNAPITIGSTNLTFVQFSGGGTYTAGNGLQLTGNVFSVLNADTSITVGGSGILVNTAVIATVASLAGYAPTTRTLTAGNGLTGGGDLSANRTFTVLNSDTSITVAAGGISVNTAVIATVASIAGMAKKYAANLTGTASPEVVTHNLNTRDIQLTVLNGATPYTAVEVDWDATTVNTATIRYNPNLGAGYRVVIVG